MKRWLCGILAAILLLTGAAAETTTVGEVMQDVMLMTPADRAALLSMMALYMNATGESDVLLAAAGMAKSTEMVVQEPDAQGTETAGHFEGAGFASPEAAVRAYAEAFVVQDVEAMMRCFAMETIAEQADFDALLEHFKVWTSYTSVPFPRAGQLQSRLNVYALAGQAYDRVFYDAYNFLLDPASGVQLQPGLPVTSHKEDEWNALMAALKTDAAPVLAKAVVGDAMSAQAYLAAMGDDGDLAQRYAGVMARSSATRGAALGFDEISDAVCTVSVGGDQLLFMGSVGRSGDTWRLIPTMVSSLALVLGGSSSHGLMFRPGELQ